MNDQIIQQKDSWKCAYKMRKVEICRPVSNTGMNLVLAEKGSDWSMTGEGF